MSDRLTKMIARLTTQKAYIDFAVQAMEGIPGAVLEIGLGKGRTYDRLRQLLPNREVHAFDQLIHCPDDVRPPENNMWLGDFRETLKRFEDEMGARAALVHADIGSDHRAADARLAKAISPAIAALLVPGGIVIGDRTLELPNCEALAPSLGSSEWEYFAYRCLQPAAALSH